MPAADTRHLYALTLPCCGASARISLPQDPELAEREPVRLYCAWCRVHHEGDYHREPERIVWRAATGEEE